MERILISIDRDGTLIKDSGDYPGSDDYPLERFELMPGVAEGLKLLRTIPGADVKIVMVTNQSGPVRGKISGTPEEVRRKIGRANEYINNALLKPNGVKLDGMYYCEHAPQSYVDCVRKDYGPDVPINPDFVMECRDWKPMTGLIERAVSDFWKKPAEPAHCKVYVIGDRVPVDIELARRAKGVGVFVPSDVKKHSRVQEAYDFQKLHPDKIYIAKGFMDGALWIVQRETENLKAA
jgi:HAD superfamily hydrolase (TIGR01662 family)